FLRRSISRRTSSSTLFPSRRSSDLMSSLSLFAQTPWYQSESAMYGAALVGLVVLAFASMALLLSQRYKRCPSNRVMVIYGKYTGSPTGTRCLHGGAPFALPPVQDPALPAREPLQLEIPA